ncbi:MAG: SURF1 family protein [Gammaproteobacteria bacterium]
MKTLRRWLPTVAMVVLVIVFARLAVWQYHRAHQREAQIAAVDSALAAPATRLVPATLAALPRYAHVYADGRYDGAHQLLLKEMSEPGGTRVGYEVLTPFLFAGGGTLMVNRGWVAVDTGGNVHADLAAPAGLVRVAGHLAPLARPGLHLGGNPAHADAWPVRLLFPGWTELERLYGRQLMHRTLLLAPTAAGGYGRNWNMKPYYGPQQNYSYMAQWIGFAVVVFALWLWFTIRRLRRKRSGT